jgi:hypothetical protein
LYRIAPSDEADAKSIPNGPQILIAAAKQEQGLVSVIQINGHLTHRVNSWGRTWPAAVNAIAQGNAQRVWNAADFPPIDIRFLPVPRYDLLAKHSYSRCRPLEAVPGVATSAPPRPWLLGLRFGDFGDLQRQALQTHEGHNALGSATASRIGEIGTGKSRRCRHFIRSFL